MAGTPRLLSKGSSRTAVGCGGRGGPPPGRRRRGPAGTVLTSQPGRGGQGAPQDPQVTGAQRWGSGLPSPGLTPSPRPAGVGSRQCPAPHVGGHSVSLAPVKPSALRPE